MCAYYDISIYPPRPHSLFVCTYNCTCTCHRVNLEPKGRFKLVENGNYVVDLGKMLKFSLINVGGLDIVDGNKKLILAIIWQLMRKCVIICM